MPPDGLRERKKARTRAAIQAAALSLFREQGYDATTVQQIAAAAEVSESTFFRYFATKPEVVLYDDFDPLVIEAFSRQPAELTPVAAVRGALRAAFARLSPAQLAEQRERARLGMAVPELRAMMIDQLTQAIGLIAAYVAERTHRAPDDVGVRTLAGAVVGAMIAVTFAAVEDAAADLPTLVDQALAELEGGLAL